MESLFGDDSDEWYEFEKLATKAGFRIDDMSSVSDLLNTSFFKHQLKTFKSFLNPFLFCIAWKILFVIWLSVTSLSFYFRLYHASTGMGFKSV